MAHSVVLYVFGSINVDKIIQVGDLGGPGQHDWNESVELKIAGGHGLNQALSCIRYSRDDVQTKIQSAPRKLSNNTFSAEPEVKVRLFGCIGCGKNAEQANSSEQHLIRAEVETNQTQADKNGRLVIQCLKENRISLRNVWLSTTRPTSKAFIQVSKNGESVTRNYLGGANEDFTTALLADAWLNGSETPDALLIQLEIPQETVLGAVRKARNAKVPIFLNAAPLKSSGLKTGAIHADIDADLYKVDHFIVNARHANMLRGFGAVGGPPGAADLPDKDVDKAWRRHYEDICMVFHSQGAKAVVITMGEHGALATTKDPDTKQLQICWAGALQAEVDEPVVDTTGASDAFIGAYAVEMTRQVAMDPKKVSLQRALEAGIRAGALTLTKVGSSAAIPWRNELEHAEFFAASC